MKYGVKTNDKRVSVCAVELDGFCALTTPNMTTPTFVRSFVRFTRSSVLAALHCMWEHVRCRWVKLRSIQCGLHSRDPHADGDSRKTLMLQKFGRNTR